MTSGFSVDTYGQGKSGMGPSLYEKGDVYAVHGYSSQKRERENHSQTIKTESNTIKLVREKILNGLLQGGKCTNE